MDELNEQFGSIDIYLFDQLLRRRLTPGMRVLDAGCGGGRNIHYLLRAGFDVHAVDSDPAAVAAVRRLALRLAPALPPENFRAEPVETMTFPDAHADAVISIAVLHFARDDAQFAAMLTRMWRALRDGGILFCRLASNIGMEHRMRRLEGDRFMMPDGSERYLVSEEAVIEWTLRLGGTLMDPLKTTVVQDQRCMTTWVLQKTPPR